jgi:hypothetical protein
MAAIGSHRKPAWYDYDSDLDDEEEARRTFDFYRGLEGRKNRVRLQKITTIETRRTLR